MAIAGIGAPLDGRPAPPDELVTGHGHQSGLVGQARDHVGVAEQDLAHDPARSQHVAKTTRYLRRLAEGLDELVLARRSGDQVAEHQQSQVGVG